MSKKIGRNDPCWCGSGKKYKQCHLRHRSDGWRLLEREKVLRAAYSSKYCLHPQASEATCREGIASAHSISLGTLKQLARKGHVYGFKYDDFRSVMRHQGAAVPELIGINKASTFSGLCNHHDNSTFSPIDDAVLAGTNQEVFLIAYRAICREVFGKKAFMDANSESRKLLDQYPPSRVPALANMILEYQSALANSYQKLLRQKQMYDDLLLRGAYAELSSVAVFVAGDVDVVCAGAFNPKYDFDGRYVQNITTSKWRDCALLACSILPTANGLAAIFSWLKNYDDKCFPFVESLLAQDPGLVPSWLVVLAAQELDNLYMAPAWWEGLGDPLRESLVRHFQSGLGVEIAPDSLQQLEHNYVAWTLKGARRN